MRRVVFFFAGAIALVGCGGKIDDASADETTSRGDSATCTYGELGRMPGVPFGVASTSSGVFVVAAQFVNNAANSPEGNLYSVTSAGVVALNQNTAQDLVAFEDQVGYLRVETTTNGDLRATNFQSSDANGAFAQIDAVNDSYVDISSIAFDGKNKLDWYRWPTLGSAGQPRAPPAIASTSAPGQPITTSTIDPDVLGVGAFVTDGQHFYAAFNTKEDGSVIGVLPVDADPKVVLVPSFARPLEALAVDDTMLLYSANANLEIWEVPTAGGTALLAYDGPPSSAKPLLHDHNIYFVDSSNVPTNTIWELSETPNSIAKVVVATSTPIYAIAADSCGIVYTTSDDVGQNAIVTRVAF